MTITAPTLISDTETAAEAADRATDYLDKLRRNKSLSSLAASLGKVSYNPHGGVITATLRTELLPIRITRFVNSDGTTSDYLACGSAARCGDGIVWALDALTELVASRAGHE